MSNKVILTVLVLLIFMTGILIYKENKESKENNLSTDEINEIDNITNEVEYGEKMAILKKDNGWYYYIYENTNGEYFFDGCNLKYNELDGYYVNIYENESMKEIYYKMPTFPSLSVSDHSKGNTLERDDVQAIDRFFTERNFEGSIEEKDLSELKITNFAIDDILNLYNTLAAEDFSSELTTLRLSECDYVYDDLKNGFKVFIGFLVERRGVAAIEIDLIYNNGTYLSDLISNNKASNKQIKLYENFQKIEGYIINNQDLDISSDFAFKGDEYNRIYKLLNSVERNK